jgi:hypothetical protein
MRIVRSIQLSMCAAALCAACAAVAKADTWDKKTIVNFGNSIEIPGQVLPAGTYVFKLDNSSSDRHIVQVWNADQSQLLAILHAVPSERMYPPDSSIFEFDNRLGNSPNALHYWFYPGDTIGQEFVYPANVPEPLE